MIILLRLRSVLAVVLSCLVAIGASAGTPPDVTLEDFRDRVHRWFAQHSEKSSLELLRHADASAELHDLRWRLQELLNQGESMKGFEDVGIQAGDDGRSVSFDLERFPQWMPLDRQVTILADPPGFRMNVPAMQQHGLTAEGLKALTAYLTNNDLAARRFWMNKPLADWYFRLLEADEKKATDLTRAFAYEAMRKSYELDHSWTVGLFDSVDESAQLAIASSFDESARRAMSAMGADGDPKVLAPQLIALYRSPKYQREMRKRETEYAQPRSLNYSLEPPTPVEEPRDPAWSSSMQQKLEQFFANHPLADRFQIVDVDCRTTYCEIKARGELDAKPNDAFVQAIDELAQLGWGLRREGGGSGPNRDGTGYEMHHTLRRDSDE